MHTNQICVLAKTFSSRLRLVLQGPLLDDPDLVGAGGIVVYGETALRCWKICCLTTVLLQLSSFRGEGNFHGASKIFPEVTIMIIIITIIKTLFSVANTTPWVVKWC